MTGPKTRRTMGNGGLKAWTTTASLTPLRRRETGLCGAIGTEWTPLGLAQAADICSWTTN